MSEDVICKDCADDCSGELHCVVCGGVLCAVCEHLGEGVCEECEAAQAAADAEDEGGAA